MANDNDNFIFKQIFIFIIYVFKPYSIGNHGV